MNCVGNVPALFGIGNGIQIGNLASDTYLRIMTIMPIMIIHPRMFAKENRVHRTALYCSIS
jgi:hypothetical protein